MRKVSRQLEEPYTYQIRLNDTTSDNSNNYNENGRTVMDMVPEIHRNSWDTHGRQIFACKLRKYVKKSDKDAAKFNLIRGK